MLLAKRSGGDCGRARRLVRVRRSGCVVGLQLPHHTPDRTSPVKGMNAKQQADELSTIIRRFAKRHGLELRGHIRVGNTILWANYGGVEPTDPLLLSQFLQQAAKVRTDGNNTERSASPDSGDGSALR